jgi:hypothetical protein
MHLMVIDLSQKPLEMAEWTEKRIVLCGMDFDAVSKRRLQKRLSEYPHVEWVASFDARVTHVVVHTSSRFIAKRKAKYLFGLACGCWMVSSRWLDACLSSGLWNIPEDAYEIQGEASQMTYAPRLSRLAGDLSLFTGAFYVHESCDRVFRYPFTIVKLLECLRTVRHADIDIVTQPSGIHSDTIVLTMQLPPRTMEELAEFYQCKLVSVQWIIDCLVQFKSLQMADYLNR